MTNTTTESSQAAGARAVEWLRNNYQDHANIAALCDAMGAALSAPPAGLPVTQEPKYTVSGTHIVNRHSGEAVPHDEPVFVFRARDALGVRALEAYVALIGEREPSSAHADAVRRRIADFERFALVHADRMKWPDTAPEFAPPVAAVAQPVADGPGSPAMRFKLLMKELDKRFPDPEPFRADLPERRLLARIDASLAASPIAPQAGQAGEEKGRG